MKFKEVKDIMSNIKQYVEEVNKCTSHKEVLAVLHRARINLTLTDMEFLIVSIEINEKLIKLGKEAKKHG